MPHKLVYSPRDFVTKVFQRNGRHPAASSRHTEFDETIRTGWMDRMKKGLFRYHLGALQTRVLPGPLGFVAQLNVARGVERRKPQEMMSIQQEFNAKQFNFNKVNPEEIICELVKDTVCDSGEVCPPRKMVVLVNVSPLEFGHCLFVPDPSHCLPQILTLFAIQAAIESMLLSSDAGFRMGFNGLGGLASVNHLHLHAYYLDHELKIESAPTKPLLPEKGFHRLLTFPAAFLFYAEAEQVEEVAEVICRVTDFLVGRNVAHNLFFTRGCPPQASSEEDRCLRNGVRIALWPRSFCFGAKVEPAFNVAMCELAGHLPVKNQKDYEMTTEEEVINVIQNYLLPDDDFHSVEQQLIEHLKGL